VTNAAALTTRDDNSHGIFALSVGGGGGNGVAGILGNVENQGGTSLDVAVGGTAGSGSSGGTVQVTTSGNITTGGNGSKALVAQSVGGGGGHGGVGIDGKVTATSTSSSSASQLTVALGAPGGSGGDGNSVTVSIASTASIRTGIGTDGTPQHFQQMDGVFAQSVGGGGGNAGVGVRGDVSADSSGSGSSSSQNDAPKALTVALGAAGGAGGTGGSVTVTSQGSIAVLGDSSRGIVAQSVGGGGGNGSAGLAGSVSGATGSTVSFALGQTGGSGATGGTVSVTNSGQITTGTTHDARWVTQQHGIFAQSVGGGGGVGTMTGSLLLGSTGTSEAHGIAMTLGGTASGGTGGNVTVTNQSGGTITTFTDSSHGIFAQSVGGGGGSAGDLGGIGSANRWQATAQLGSSGGSGSGGTVQIGNAASVTTGGDGANALYVQSIGGGGGDAAAGSRSTEVTQSTDNARLAINVGAGSASSGDGGTVSVTHSAGTLVTTGRSAAAILVQSIGGGGGTGGLGAVGSTGSTITVGGTGSVSGNGGAVTVTVSGGSISTGSLDPGRVVASYGVLAQSIGGGGGLAGTVSMGATSNFGTSLAMSQGTSTSGDGGTVILGVSANVATRGDSSVGLFAQSVGGGGGIAGQPNASSGALIGSSGGTGSGGAVTVTYSGSLTTNGAGAHGIFAQSAGGQGTGGAVSVTLASNAGVSVQGAGAYGILAQSVGLQGNGTIAVAIGQNATVNGGSGTGGGILLQGGSASTVTNQGTVAAGIAIASGIAIQVSSAAGQSSVGPTTIGNSGIISGQVLVNGGTGTFNNLSGGTFNTGNTVTLGTSGVLSNAGTLAPGGKGQILTTTVSQGSLVQTSGGVLAVDIAASTNQADKIVVAGTAQLAGAVQANLVSTQQTISGAATIVSATGGVATSTQTSLAAPASTAVATYSLAYPNANDIVLNYSVNYANSGIRAAANSNQSAIAGNLQQAAANGAVDSSLSGLTGIASVGGYLAALDTLSPQIMADHQIAALFSGMQFGDALLSCAARDGAYRFVRQDRCGWARVDAWGLSRPTSTVNRAYSFASFQIAGGAQFDVGDDWLLGGGLSIEFQNMAVESLAWSRGTFGQLGLVAKRSFGDTMLSASLAAGYGQFNLSRSLFNGSTATSVLPQWMIAGQVRASHAFAYGNVYLKPRVDAGFQYVGTGALAESGAGGAGLAVQGTGQTYFTIQPAIELGGDLMLGGTLVRPNVTVGLTQFIGSAAPSVTASFLSAPGVAPFTVNSSFATTYLDIGANIDVFVQGNVVLSLQGAGKFSSSTIGYGGGLKAALKF